MVDHKWISNSSNRSSMVMIVEMSLVSLQLLLWCSPLALPKLTSHGLAQQLLVWHATVKLKRLQL
jgi:hypothetical protein